MRKLVFIGALFCFASVASGCGSILDGNLFGRGSELEASEGSEPDMMDEQDSGFVEEMSPDTEDMSTSAVDMEDMFAATDDMGGFDEDMDIPPLPPSADMNTGLGSDMDYPPSSCGYSCERLVNDCGRDEPDCIASCELTVEGWSEDARMLFLACLAGETEPQLTCEMAIMSDAPASCYQRLPFPEDRKMRCDGFEQRARVVTTSAEERLTEFRNNCYVLARTRSDEIWSSTDVCDDANLPDEDFIDCIEQMFGVRFQ